MQEACESPDGQTEWPQLASTGSSARIKVGFGGLGSGIPIT